MKTYLPLFKGADIHIYIHIDLSIFALYLKKAYHIDIISYYQLWLKAFTMPFTCILSSNIANIRMAQVLQTFWGFPGEQMAESGWILLV